MDGEEIISIIQKRRAEFHDRQIIGSPADPLEFSGPDVSRAIADEYGVWKRFDTKWAI